MAGIGHTYTVRAFGDPISDGSAGVRYADISALVKENTSASPFVVANEAVATALAQMLALPAPAGGIVRAEDGGLAWASLHFGPGGQRPPPVIPEQFVEAEPLIAAAVVVFDMWIVNDDRHERNLAYAPGLIPPAVIDHGHALLGPDEQGLARLMRRKDTPGVAGCLHDELADASHLSAWADEVACVTRRRIEAVCKAVGSACALDGELTQALIDFLDHRKTRIMEFVREAETDFPHITQWSIA